MKNFKKQILADYLTFKLQKDRPIINASNSLYIHSVELYKNNRINSHEFNDLQNDITKAMSFAVNVISSCPFVYVDFNINKYEFEEFYNFLINSKGEQNE